MAVLVEVEVLHHLGGGLLGVAGDAASEGEDLLALEDAVAVLVDVLEDHLGVHVDARLVAIG